MDRIFPCPSGRRSLALAAISAFLLTGCQSSGTGPQRDASGSLPPGFNRASEPDHLISGNQGIISTTTHTDPATGVRFSVGTAWHQGPEPIEPRTLVGTWHLADNGGLNCGLTFSMTRLPAGQGALRTERAASCHPHFNAISGWSLEVQTLRLTDIRGQVLATLRRERDGSFKGSLRREGQTHDVTLRWLH